jgi:hypothetical protein
MPVISGVQPASHPTSKGQETNVALVHRSMHTWSFNSTLPQVYQIPESISDIFNVHMKIVVKIKYDDKSTVNRKGLRKVTDILRTSQSGEINSAVCIVCCRVYAQFVGVSNPARA